MLCGTLIQKIWRTHPITFCVVRVGKWRDAAHRNQADEERGLGAWRGIRVAPECGSAA